jgi:DNA (cytosine-5)-methyltransferase 1
MKYLSLFSGIGGFELGIQQAHENNHRLQRGEEQGKDGNEDSLGRDSESLESEPRGNRNPMCIGYSEIDKYAVEIYQKRFPEHKNYGDIKTINTSELPNFDLLVGGFPCQSFSIAGKRGGFEDTRGTLFFDIARILKAKLPRLFLLENVKGLLSHDDGRTFKTIISTLDELGYDLQWQVLNSKNFGVPQNRERVFIVGHLRGTRRPQVFPFGEDGAEYNAVEQQQPQVTGTINSSMSKGGNRQDSKANVLIRADKSNLLKERDKPDNTNRRGGEAYPPSVRRLTPTECERLQGFPDGWTEGVSDTQRYKCLGNAVTVNVIREIIKRL